MWQYLERGVDLPYEFNDYQWKKLAQKGDMVRVALLKKYGGLWVDASIVAVKPFYEMYNNIINDIKAKGGDYADLEYIGWLNKAPVDDKFEFSIWMMLSLTPNCQLFEMWHDEQMKLLYKYTQKTPMTVEYENPMYLDFGDCVMKKIMPKF